MKKILLILILLCVGCNMNYQKKGYTEVSIDDFFGKVSENESFVIVIGSDTCSACEEFRVTMEDVITKEEIEIFYLDLDRLSEEEYSRVYSKFVITNTPTTIFFKDGVETSTYDRIIGTLDYKDVVKKLTNLGYMGELYE